LRDFSLARLDEVVEEQLLQFPSALCSIIAEFAVEVSEFCAPQTGRLCCSVGLDGGFLIIDYDKVELAAEMDVASVCSPLFTRGVHKIAMVTDQDKWYQYPWTICVTPHWHADYCGPVAGCPVDVAAVSFGTEFRREEMIEEYIVCTLDMDKRRVRWSTDGSIWSKWFKLTYDRPYCFEFRCIGANEISRRSRLTVVG
jgi:hypothetical protein